ncbi:Mitotic checkpoint protein BUB3.3 [Sesamum angolense]|uniref:Mitotic checkpoint protein BUB3.3 n=1 Tax=Sesamum angolense TaxID=2727404 RepID=A0AAE2BZ32_9LAMI|nr:Mitotic checkpoint protein BUB3.3 [Sesamum angolense]
MNATCLNFNKPIRDAISRIRFAPDSNNLLISSWDSWVFHIIEQSLRLYDVDKCELRLETPTEGAALLDCCFESESMALSANSDGSILRYDMHLGTSETIGNHDDLATCVEYCEETGQVITAGWDKKVKFWDARSGSSFGCLSNVDVEVESVSISGLNLMVALRSSVHIFVVGSTDGRVALEYLGKPNSTNEGYAFRCHPKDKNGRHHLIAVNDIAFHPFLCGVLVTGDNEGHATIWDVLNRKRLLEPDIFGLVFFLSKVFGSFNYLIKFLPHFQLPRYPNSVASMAYNHEGQLLAVGNRGGR